MKRSQIKLLQELLVTQINQFIFFPLAMTVVILLCGVVEPIRPSMLVWFFGGLLALLFYQARQRCKQFLSFLAVHLAVLAGSILLLHFHSFLPGAIWQPWDNIINRILFFLSVAGFAVNSLFLRLHEEQAESNVMPMPVAVGICAVGLYLQHYMGFRDWDASYKLSLILVIGMYFLYFYLKEYLNFLVVNASSTGVLPEKEIFGSGLRLACGYTLMGGVILIGTSQTQWLKAILRVLKQIVTTILHFVFSLFPKGKDEIPDIIVEENVQGGISELPEPGEPGIIWQILWTVVSIAVLLMLLYCLYKAILNAIAFVKAKMGKSIKLSTQELHGGVQDVREKCETVKKKRKSSGQSHRLFGFLEPQERIRHIYQKKVEAYKPMLLDDKEIAHKKRYTPERAMYYTAREMEQEMQLTHMAEIYEKARYSQTVCTAEDVRKMKEYSR